MSNEEILFRIIESSLSFCTVILIIFGWIIPYRQSKKLRHERNDYEKKIERIKLERAFVDKQISQLYGPLAAIIREANISFGLITYQLGRRFIFEQGRELRDLPENEQKIWMHYVDTYKLPSQAKMIKILRDNIELMYNSEIPDCFYTFLNYCIGWELLDNQRKSGVPNYYAYHYSYNYPKEFDRYIFDTLKILLDKQKQLYNYDSVV